MCPKWIYKLPEYIDSNNSPLLFIIADDDSSSGSSVSVSLGYVHLNDDVEISCPPAPPLS